MPQHVQHDTINLHSKDDVSKVVAVRDATKLSVSIVADTTTFTGTTWKVDIEYSIGLGVDEQGRSVEDWRAFSTAIQLDSTTPALRKKSVTGAGHIRARTSTGDTTKGDPHARIQFLLS